MTCLAAPIAGVDVLPITISGVAANGAVHEGRDGPFRFAPGAFANCLQSDVYLTMSHNKFQGIAQTTDGSLFLDEVAGQLFFDARPHNSSFAKHVVGKIEARKLWGVSTGFIAGESEKTIFDGKFITTILECEELFEITLTGRPANPTAWFLMNDIKKSSQQNQRRSAQRLSRRSPEANGKRLRLLDTAL